MTWVDFIAQIGGLIAICMGISMISLIEVAYWLAVSTTSEK